MLTLLLFALASIAFAQGPPTTTVTVQLYSTFGAASSGTIVITNEAFTIGTFTIPKQSQTILVPSSGLTVPLVQTVGSVPPTIYRVQTTVTGVMSVTYWNIPAGGPVAIKDVLTIPTVGATVLLAQLYPIPLVNTTPVSAGNDTTEDTLQSVTVPANTLTTGKYLRATAIYMVAGGGATTFLYFGATQVCRSGDQNDFTPTFQLLIMGLGPSSQMVVCTVLNGAGASPSITTTPTESTTAGIIIHGTGQNDIAAPGNITQILTVVEPGN